MRRVVATEYVTLDGVMEDPGGLRRFAQANWHFPFLNEETKQYKHDELFASDALLLGRATYEEFAAAWPSITDETGFADRMNSLPQIRRVQDPGHADLLHTLMGRDLIDEYRLLVHPVVAGGGKRLFSEGGAPRTLRLVEVTPFSSGVVALTYRPQRNV